MAGHVLKIEYHYEQPTLIQQPLPDIQQEPTLKKLTLKNQNNPEEDSKIQINPLTQASKDLDQHLKPFREAGEIIEDDSESVEIPKPSSKSKKFIEDVCDALIEANPTIFKIKRTNKKKPKSALITCELCHKDFKKSSIRNHVTSKSHQSKLT